MCFKVELMGFADILMGVIVRVSDDSKVLGPGDRKNDIAIN